MEKTSVLCIALLLCVLGVPQCQAQCATKLYECSNLLATAFANLGTWIQAFNISALNAACSQSNLQTCMNAAKTACASDANSMTSVNSLQQQLDSFCSPSGDTRCTVETTICQKPVMDLASQMGNGTFTTQQLQAMCTAYGQVETCLSGKPNCAAFAERMGITQSFASVKPMCDSISGGNLQCSTKLYECSTLLQTAFDDAGTWVQTFNISALNAACSQPNLQTCMNAAKTACASDATSVTSVNSLQQQLDMYCSPSGDLRCQVETTVCQKPVMDLGSLVGNGTFTTQTLQALCTAYGQVQTCISGKSNCAAFAERMGITQSFASVQPLCSSISGGNLQCSTKLYECSMLLSAPFANAGAFTETFNISALDAVCSQPNLQTCINAAKTACASDATSNTSVNSLQQQKDMICSPSGDTRCAVETYICQKPVMDIASQMGNESNGFNPQQLQAMCTAYGQVETCLSGKPNCAAFANRTGITQSFASVKPLCDSVSGGFCPSALTCLSSLASMTGGTLVSQCGLMAGIVQCMGGQKSTCKFNEGKITYNNLYTASSGLCTDAGRFPASYLNCSAVDTCMVMSPGLSNLASIFPGDMDMSNMQGMIQQVFGMFSNTTLMCKVFEAAARCYVSQADTCKFSADFVNVMTARRVIMSNTCAGESPTGGSDQVTSTFAHLVLTAMVALLLTVTN